MRNPAEGLSLKYTYAMSKLHSNVLPRPAEGMGWDWDKPHRYIAAGIACWDVCEDKAAVDEVIRKLEGGESSFSFFIDL